MQTVQARSFSTSPYRSDVPRRKPSKSDHKGRFVPNPLASDALVEASGASKANISSTASTRTRTRKPTITVPYKPVERKRAALPQLDLVTGKELNSSDQDLKAEWNMAVKERSFPDTPLAKEIFNNMKAYPDDIVLTKVGMFYESYFTQASRVASILGIMLTSKKYKSGSETFSFPFAGFPCTQKERYFQKLLNCGHSFVVIEERDKPNSTAKDRYPSRRFTPGTLLSEEWQDNQENRYLLALSFGDASKVSDPDALEIPIDLAYIDVSTDRTVQKRSSTLGELEHELARITPVEIVLDRSFKPHLDNSQEDSPAKSHLQQILHIVKPLLYQSGATLSYIDVTSLPLIDTSTAAERLIQAHLESCLIDFMPKLLPASDRKTESFMQIDASTLLGLEIRQAARLQIGNMSLTPHAASRAGTLLSVVRKTVTPSGTRLLVNSLCQPSTDLELITNRHDLVEAFVLREPLRADLRHHLRQSSDQRDIAKIVQLFASTGRDNGGALAGGRDLWDLKLAIDGLHKVAEMIQETLVRESDSARHDHQRLVSFVADMKPLKEWTDRVAQAVIPSALERQAVASGEQPPTEPETEALATEDQEWDISDQEQQQDDGGEFADDGMWWISSSFSPAVKDLHVRLNTLYKEKAALQEQLRQEYRISGLYLRHAFAKTPAHVRIEGLGLKTTKVSLSILEQDRATAVLSARSRSSRTYMHTAWSELADKIEHIKNDISDAQRSAFKVFKQEVMSLQDDFLHNASLLAELDLCLGFAQVAQDHQFVRPVMDHSNVLDIINGRHPTVEQGLLSNTETGSRNFVPNSVRLDSDHGHVHVITGPNMAGKSTLLRQTAIIAILAQAGSFVPADRARLGIIDAVFSRVGARDDLFMDRSTFMIEMHETAHILNKATSKSLVIMDEIGRGTTLNSGIAIAYSTLDYILKHNKCKTLFATHYHELEDLLGKGSRTRKGVEYWCTDAHQEDGHFAYTYRLKPGVNRQSYALKAAKQAGMPDGFLKVAQKTLTALDQGQLLSESSHAE